MGACRSAVHGPRGLWLGGDVHLGASEEDRMVALEPTLRGLVGVVNLEGPLALDEEALALDFQPAGTTVKLGNAVSGVATLRRAGVVAIGVANNHSHDFGTEHGARSHVAAKELGLVLAGDAGSEPAPVLLVAGKRVGLTAHDLTKGVPSGLGQELTRARSDCDLLVSTFHVTGPPSYLPRPELREATEVALGSGASIVASHGTHALGPVERRGDALIAWGLGNLLFSCRCTDERDGAILQLFLNGPAPRARVVPIEAGLGGQGAKLAKDPQLLFELLRAIGSSELMVDGEGAWV